VTVVGVAVFWGVVVGGVGKMTVQLVERRRHRPPISTRIGRIRALRYHQYHYHSAGADKLYRCIM
jgi:hypothetical protein